MLLQKLIEKQNMLKETDAIFAQRMGISRSFWTRIRGGKERLTLHIVSATLVLFPELTDEIILFLQQNASLLTKSVSK